MSDIVFLVSPTRVKRDTAFQSTVDESVIRPFIQIAQDRHIWPVLGSKLYDFLKEEIVADRISGQYETLLNDYIQPALVQFVFTECAYVLRLRFSNNSIGIAASEVGQSASIQDIKLVKEQAESIAMFYRERLIDYLQNNQSLFPQYHANTGSDLSPSARNYFQGLNVYPRYPVSNQVKAYLQGIGAKIYN